MAGSMFRPEDLFCTTIAEVRERLAWYGVAVFPSVLNEAECEALLRKTAAHFEHITQKWPVPYKLDDEKTHHVLQQLLPSGGGLFQRYGVGQSEAAWSVRQHPGVIAVFQALYPGEELTTSFDGVNYTHPPSIRRKTKSGLHTDQSPLCSDQRCVQGSVTALPIGPGNGTLTFLRGSHLHHSRLRVEGLEAKQRGNWWPLTSEQREEFRALGCEQCDVVCPAGSLVLWDSRTVHAGKRPDADAPVPRLRCVIFVCMMPRPKDPAALARLARRKQAAVAGLRTTCHWPASGMLLFAEKARTYDSSVTVPEITPIPPPAIGPVGRRLGLLDHPVVPKATRPRRAKSPPPSKLRKLV